VTPERALADAVAAAPAPVRFWWRDDDAGRDDERLVPLLRLAERRAAPVALAVVPRWLEEACRVRILAAGSATVLQHGISHADHAVPPAKKIELGGSAAREQLLADLRRGRELLAGAFGSRFVPALVPPWNRIAADVVPLLCAAGFTGVSTFGPRRAADAARGLRRVNTHLDLVVWREGGRQLDLASAMARLAQLVIAHGDEPIGILSHHKVMDTAALSTLDRLLALVQDQSGATLVAAGALFGEGR
jgi:hypothetical protein